MRYNTTLILAAVVLVAAALIYVYRDQLTGEQKPPPKPSDTLPLVESVKFDEVTGATLEEAAADGTMKTRLAAKKADGKWRLAEPVDAPADDYELGRLLRAAVEGKYRQTIEPGAKGQPGLEALGLAPPAYRLTVSADAKDPKPARAVVVEIGRKASFGEGAYVRLADAKKVVVLEKADLLERAREKLDTYRSRDLVSLVRDDVVRIDLEGEKGKVRLDKAEGPEGRWVLAQPISARADSEVTSGILRAALDTRAKDFVDDAPADLARYGLDKPRLVVTLWKAGPPPEKPKETRPAGEKPEEKPAPKPEPVKAATLKFGAWADLKRESVYLQIEGSRPVVAAGADAFNGASKGLADLRDKHVLALDPTRATQVAVRLPAKLAEKGAEVAYDLTKTDGAWQVKVAGRPDGKADAAAVESLLKELAGLKVIYFAEGEHAEVAKGFQSQGSVRIRMEKESADIGFEIGGAAEVPALVKNLREDWVGRINEKGLERLRKDWLEALDKQVFAFDPKQATRLAIQTADRTVVLEKKGDKWAMTQPVEAEPQATFAADRLSDVQDLRCTKFLAATKDFKAHHLDPAELAVTVTLAPAKDGEKPVEKTLRLAHQEKATIVGRVEGGDLVFEAPLALFKDLASEPLSKQVTDVPAKDIKTLDIAAGDAKLRLLKVDEKWYRADAAGRPGEEVLAGAVEDVVKAATDLKAVRWAAYDAKDLAQFGLDKPAVRITASGDNNVKAAVLVSDKEVPPRIAALFDERPLRFAMAEGGQRIAIVAGRPAENLSSAPKTLAPVPAKTETPRKTDEPKPPETKPGERKDEAKPAEK